MQAPTSRTAARGKPDGGARQSGRRHAAIRTAARGNPDGGTGIPDGGTGIPDGGARQTGPEET